MLKIAVGFILVILGGIVSACINNYCGVVLLSIGSVSIGAGLQQLFDE